LKSGSLSSRADRSTQPLSRSRQPRVRSPCFLLIVTKTNAAEIRTAFNRGRKPLVAVEQRRLVPGTRDHECRGSWSDLPRVIDARTCTQSARSANGAVPNGCALKQRTTVDISFLSNLRHCRASRKVPGRGSTIIHIKSENWVIFPLVISQMICGVISRPCISLFFR
jgi:hypothetical protein